eukprot:SM000081S22671  [mRNA]  locus=s81:471709:478152:- [translate_table: standard]
MRVPGMGLDDAAAAAVGASGIIPPRPVRTAEKVAKPEGFWNQARVAFNSTFMTDAQVDALRSKVTAGWTAVLNEDKALALLQDPPGSLPTAEADAQETYNREVEGQKLEENEAESYMTAMRAEWLALLKKEIALLSVCKLLISSTQHAARLAEREVHISEDGTRQSKPGYSIPSLHSGSGSIAPTVAAAKQLLQTLPKPPTEVNPSLAGKRRVSRYLHSLSKAQFAKDLSYTESRKDDIDPAAASMVASAQHEQSLRRLQSMPAEKPSPSSAVTVVADKGWTKKLRWRSSNATAENFTGIRTALDKPNLPASPAAVKARRAVLQRKTSGVRAAIAAAEAADTGGKRMKRVWEKMRRIILGSRKADADKLLEVNVLSDLLRKGEIQGTKMGSTWVALAERDADANDLMSRTRYKDLLHKPSKFSKEIERDLHRTFPEHALFIDKDGPGQRALYNVTHSYSVFDMEVGYCQGMAFIVAVLLMQLQVRLYQLSQLLREALPSIQAHLEEQGITPVMYAAPWFLTLFATSLPLRLVNRIFDVIFAEQTSAIIFKLALVLLQVCQRQLLQCLEIEFLMHFLRKELLHELSCLGAAELEELMAKALRVELRIESLLRLEAEYELLAEEAAMATNEVAAAAAASEAAARASEEAAEQWQRERADLEARLLLAIEGQRAMEDKVRALEQRIRELQARQGAGSASPLSPKPRSPKAMASIDADDLVADQAAGAKPAVVHHVTQDDLDSSHRLRHTDALISGRHAMPSIAHLPQGLSSWRSHVAASPTEGDMKTATAVEPKLGGHATQSSASHHVSTHAQAITATTRQLRDGASPGELGSCHFNEDSSTIINCSPMQRGHRSARLGRDSSIPTLLRAVAELRKERAAVCEALKDAESVLSEQIRQENLLLQGSRTEG